MFQSDGLVWLPRQSGGAPVFVQGYQLNYPTIALTNLRFSASTKYLGGMQAHAEQRIKGLKGYG
ncbi:hypothetical protein, partial [Methyloglobulus morosus]|uniref:hypothetical protein n=1 Tax=Methyloglobulus morosus TaxID=1410681 RepID=UPI001F3602CB